MGLMDELKNIKPLELGGTGATFIDADTLTDGKQNYRIQGIDSAEVEKFAGGEYKQGTAGGAATTPIVHKLANDQGYTNIVKLTNPDGTPMMDTTGKRQMIDLTNEAGESFRSRLLQAEAFDANKYTTEHDLALLEIEKGKREQAQAQGEYTPNAFDQASNLIQAAEIAEGAKSKGFKITALDELERQAYIQAGYEVTDQVQVRSYDRDINNNSNNPLSDAWNIGLNGAKEGYYGFLQLLGEEHDVDWANDIGTNGIARVQAQSENYAHILTDWKDVEGFKTGVSFLANNAAMSMPYMLGIMGATVAGGAATIATGGGAAGAAIGLGISVLPSSAVYAGQVWNEMEGEKDANIALTAGLIQGSLDRLGFGALKGVAPNNLTAAAVKKIAKQQGVSSQAASEMLANATKQELASFLKAGGSKLSAQLAAKETGKTLLKSAIGEGSTEMLQEATGYIAATEVVGGSDKKFDWEELNERLIAAGIAGSTLGAGFGTPGAVNNVLQHRAIVGDNAVADNLTATNSALWAQEEVDANGYVASNTENLAKVHQQISQEGAGVSLEERADTHRARSKAKPLEDRVTNALANIPALWKGATRNIFTDKILSQSRAARMAADLFGGNPDRVFSGAAFEDAKHHKVTQYKNMVSIPNKVFYALNDGKRFKRSDKERLSNMAYSKLRGAVKDGKFDPALLPNDKYKSVLTKLGTELNALSDKMYADQKKHNPELGYIDNYLFKYKSLRKESVHHNRKKFEQLIQSEYKLSAAEAKELTDRIVDDPNVSDISEAFSVVKGGIVPSSHRKRSLGMSENNKFSEFMENDIFANISHAAKSAARYSAHRDYIGKNGEVVSKLLDNIQQDLGNTKEAQEVVEKIAAQMQDYLDAESGNYKRPTSEFGKKAQKVQKFAMMLMTFSGLPLAVFSSFVEAALVGRGLNSSQIFGKDKLSLKNQGKDLAKGMAHYINGLNDAVIGDTYREESSKEQQLRELGFYEWEVGAATVTGVTETNAYQQKFYDAFFKVNGLTQWTDYTRSIRASFAGDFMAESLKKISDQRRAGDPYTRDIQETELKMRNLGLNIDQIIPINDKVGAGIPLTPEEQAQYETNIREATFTFVNDAIVLPQAANRPLIYQDPRFALFTQFQGFLSTFTAKVLPKLYRDAFGGGTPTMQYQAFATMATMIMLGFASQAMKDWIKYDLDPGEDDFEDKTGSNPYLDTPEYIRRGLLSTGLLGTGERVINTMFPIYETRSDGPGDWVFNQATGESPALGYISRVVNATGKLAGGDVGRATEQAFKAAPIFGPFSAINRSIGDAASGWNFNGEN